MISDRISDDIHPKEIFEYGYPHSNAPLQFLLKFERCKPRNAARHQTKYDVINDVKMFPAVYRGIYFRKFLTLSNQKSRYKSKCIRIVVYRFYCTALYHSQGRRRVINVILFAYI